MKHPGDGRERPGAAFSGHSPDGQQLSAISIARIASRDFSCWGVSSHNGPSAIANKGVSDTGTVLSHVKGLRDRIVWMRPSVSFDVSTFAPLPHCFGPEILPTA